MTRTWTVASILLISCGASGPPAPETSRAPSGVPSDLGAPTDSGAPATAGHGPAAGSSRPAGTPPVAGKELPAALRLDDRIRVERLLEANVFFLITGEDGRIAALADEAGTVVPHRFERGAWQTLALPAAEQTTADAASLGIYFGRDNRPRLMGHRQAGAGRRMVYLRYRDGAWQDQRSEIGALAGDASQLYGVLGEADPEVVCKLGGICLLKSRKGWKEVANTIPPTSVVRLFAGKAWALTPDGVFRADDGGFTRASPPASWKLEATGFWVGEGGAMAVVEPAANAIHILGPGATSWKVDRSPIRGPRDVFGPEADRWICGDGGVAHGDGSAFSRAGEPSLQLARWIATKDGALAGGPSGVFVVRAAAP